MKALLRSPYGLCLLLVSTMTGLISVGYPVALANAGFGKPGIALFFVLDSLTAFTLALLLSRRRALRHARAVLVTCLLAGAGGIALVGGTWLPLVCVGGALSMAAAVTMPLILTQLQRAPTTRGLTDSVLSAGTRWIAVTGYVVGVGGFGASASLGSWWPGWVPVHAGVPVLVLAAGASLLGTPTTSSYRRKQENATPQPQLALAVLLFGIAAIVLLKAADSIRLVYLPLYVVATSQDPRLISALFLTTAAAELLILPLLGKSGDRHPTPQLLGTAALVGVVSFAVTAAFATLPALLLSQLLYAPFTAALQAYGPVLLGRLLAGGLPAGAGLFAALMQLGSLIGILAPLTVPGYHSTLFWIAAAFCATAATALLTLTPAKTGAPHDRTEQTAR